VTTPRERAWEGVHDALPAGWRTGRPSYDPGRHAWTVAAIGPLTGKRGVPPDHVEAQGEDETAALTYLATALHERHEAGRLAELRRRARLAYLSGAEERSTADAGRGLTSAEQERVIESLSRSAISNDEGVT
jgi:hypothetical protein